MKTSILISLPLIQNHQLLQELLPRKIRHINSSSQRRRRRGNLDCWRPKVVQPLLAADLIDTFILTTIPLFLGEGIALYETMAQSIPVRLKQVYQKMSWFIRFINVKTKIKNNYSVGQVAFKVLSFS